MDCLPQKRMLTLKCCNVALFSMGFVVLCVLYINTNHFTGIHRPQQFSYTRQPARHVVFLKVNKAGSSTIQNIFFRYGISNNLVFALPVRGVTIKMSEKANMTSNLYPPPSNRTYDMVCNHCLYDRKEFDQLLPPDTLYIGTVREPFSQFLSLLNYYRSMFGYVFSTNSTKPVLTYLQKKLKDKNERKISWGNNFMSLYYNFPRNLFIEYDKALVDTYLKTLDKELDFVVVTEHFDESMVLMRRILNWQLQDVLYISLKKRWKYDPHVNTTNYEERSIYREWAKLDHALYTFFFKRLFSMIKREGESFAEELLHYRFIRTQTEEFCRLKNKADAYIYFEASTWNGEFNVTRHNCSVMKQPATRFLKTAKLKQGYIKS